VIIRLEHANICVHDIDGMIIHNERKIKISLLCKYNALRAWGQV
jgi:hypothetical protein